MRQQSRIKTVDMFCKQTWFAEYVALLFPLGVLENKIRVQRQVVLVQVVLDAQMLGRSESFKLFRGLADLEPNLLEVVSSGLKRSFLLK